MGHVIHPAAADRSELSCGSCEAAGWGTDHTPLTLRVIFRGITACGTNPPPPNDYPITLDQDPATPCEYNAYFPWGGQNWWAWVRPAANGIYLYHVTNGGHLYFFGEPGICLPGPAYNVADCVASYGTGGLAYILNIPVDSVLSLALDYNFQPDAAGLYDITDALDPEHTIVRLTGRESPGSCLIEYHPP